MIDQICKYWYKALHSWLPVTQYAAVCRWISRFLLRKTIISTDAQLSDYCILKLTEFAIDELTQKLVVDWILKHECKVVMPLWVAELPIDS